MNKCVAAILAQPSQLDEQQPLPQLPFNDIPKFPVPRNVMYIRISLWIAALACMVQDASPLKSTMVPWQSAYLLFELVTILNAIFYETKDWITSDDSFDSVYITHFFFMSFSVFVMFVMSTATCVSYYFTTANICGLVVHWKYRIRRLEYYSESLKEQEGLMMDRLMDSMRHTVVFGQPFISDFLLLTNEPTHDVVWTYYSNEMREKLTLPSAIYCQHRDGSTFFYVPWASYYSVNARIKEGFPVVEDLVDKNASLRVALKRQRRLLIQLRKKIHVAWVDCTDLQEIPAMPAALPPWNPLEADALFVSIDSILSAYVSINDYQTMVVYAVNLKDTTEALKDENEKLKDLLQQRIQTSNDLIKQVLKLLPPFKKIIPEQSFEWNINDVDE